MALLGAALIFLFPGSAEQDSGYHFQMARTARQEPVNLVKVWARPFYTAVFAVPALMGLLTARMFAVGIGVAMAWQTWRLARDLRLERAWLAIPLLLGESVFFELYSDLLTEPLFALVFVAALRLHLRGLVKRGMLGASLLPLARPEGVFLCILWAAWVLVDSLKNAPHRPAQIFFRAIPATFPLAAGVVLWWAAAFAIRGDPLFILHDWPRQWLRGTYGNGTLFSYAGRALEFAGLLLAVPLLAGFWRALPMKKWMPVTLPWLLFFTLHSVLRAYGLFGEGGSRYMVSVAPATAVMTLFGWNALAAKLQCWFARVAVPFGTALLAVSVAVSFLYLDSLLWARDTVAIREMQVWLRQNSPPVRRCVWSNVGMCEETKRDFSHRPLLTAEGVQNRKLLRDLPSGTPVFWDDRLGPDWFGMTAAEIEASGYQLLRARRYALPGVVLSGDIAGWKLTREIELNLLYKP